VTGCVNGRYLVFLLKTHAEEFVQEENVEPSSRLASWWIWPL
jgi:hypothetical protein